MEPFKGRASGNGKITTNPKGLITEKQTKLMLKLQDKETLTNKQTLALIELEVKYALSKGKVPLSDTAKECVEEWVKEKAFGRKREWSNKYTIKGIQVEASAIEHYNRVKGTNHKKHNGEMWENEFCTGHPDIETSDTIIDIKSSWNIWTFPLFETEITNKDYLYQLQTYMWLSGKKKAQLAYVLVDTPDELIQSEFNKQKWNYDESEHEELLDRIVKDTCFGDIDEKLRVKTFDIERDEEIIEKIEERVIACRTYQAEIEKFIF